MSFRVKIILLSCILSGLVACVLSLLFIMIVFLVTVNWMTRHELGTISVVGLLTALCLSTMGVWETFIVRPIQVPSDSSVWYVAWNIGRVAGIVTSARFTSATMGLATGFSYGRIIGYTSMPWLYSGIAIGTLLGYGVGYLCERFLVPRAEAYIAAQEPDKR